MKLFVKHLFKILFIVALKWHQSMILQSALWAILHRIVEFQEKKSTKRKRFVDISKLHFIFNTEILFVDEQEYAKIIDKYQRSKLVQIWKELPKKSGFIFNLSEFFTQYFTIVYICYIHVQTNSELAQPSSVEVQIWVKPL